MNTASLVLDNLDRYGEYVSMHFEGQSYTNLQRYRHACQLASVLKQRGIKGEDRIVVMMVNSPEVVDAFNAIWMTGAVIIPVTPMWTERELGYVLSDSGARKVITSPELADRVKLASDGIPDFREILVIADSDVEGAVNIKSAIESADPDETITRCRDDQVAMLLYTSGTTGNPKGVMLSHDNMLFINDCIYENNKHLSQIRSMQVLPLSHIYGVLMMNLGLRMGSSMTILKHFDAGRVLETIQHRRVQRLAMVPTMLTLLINHPDRESFDISSLEYVSSGGAPLSEATRQEFQKLFNCKVVQGYGMSESSGAMSGYHPDDTYRVGSVGKPLPGVELSVQDIDNRILPAGEVGEICTRGRHVMQGYLNKPDATREAIVDGWLHSGDVGFMDDDGYIYITDRKKDLIIKGAENISPREIEEIIYSHPAVAEAAVFGVPDDLYGEDIVATVVLRKDRVIDEDDLKKHLASGITKFKIPSKIIFAESLPKNPTGKILKRALVEQFTSMLKEK